MRRRNDEQAAAITLVVRKRSKSAWAKALCHTYAGEVALLVAKPATGKSAISAYMALCISNGADFFGKKTKSGSVLFLAGEREADTRRRIFAMRNGAADVAVLGPAGAGRLDLRAENAVPSLPRPFARLEDATDEPLRFLIVDTLARCASGMGENSAKEVGVLVDTLARIATETQATVLVLRHPAKNGKGLRGSGALDGAVDQKAEMR